MQLYNCEMMLHASIAAIQTATAAAVAAIKTTATTTTRKNINWLIAVVTAAAYESHANLFLLQHEKHLLFVTCH